MSFQYQPHPLYKSKFEDFEGARLVALVRDHYELVRWAVAQGVPPIVVLLPAIWEVLGDISKEGELHQLLGNILGTLAKAEGYEVDDERAPVPPNRAGVKTAANFRKI